VKRDSKKQQHGNFQIIMTSRGRGAGSWHIKEAWDPIGALCPL